MKIDISLVYSPAARRVWEKNLSLRAGSTVGEALAQSGLQADFPDLDFAMLPIGIWGHGAGLSQPLQARDRIEIYRPLKVDPKVARRERFARQGVKKSGLFAKRRDGAKAGY